MKSNLKFKRGDFITQITDPESFAIYGGDAYDPINPGEGMDYSLICYFNMSHFEQNSDGEWIRESVFEYDLYSESSTCEYTINESDFDSWRLCTQNEIDDALRILAEKKLGWDETTKTFKRLRANEKLVIGDSVQTNKIGHNGPSTQKCIPLVRKTITLKVSDNWEQNTPITSMSDESRNFILAQCKKLEYSFSSYSYNGVRVYPQNDVQVPRRVGFNSGTYGYLGSGMCAYNDLINQDWWGYCD